MTNTDSRNSTSDNTSSTTPHRALSRRRLLTTAGATGSAGLALGITGVTIANGTTSGSADLTDLADGGTPQHTDPLTSIGSTAVPFHGTHQPGIIDPAQTHAHLVAFDLTPGAGRHEAVTLLRRWSTTAAELMAGRTPKDDHTGIALDAGPSSLTITFGFGHSFFDATGLAHARPTALAPLPAFSADALDPHRSDGDLWVQIGANDNLVAFHALRLLQCDAGTLGAAHLRWHMTGFNRTPGATAEPATARNLMGQIDGTNNPKPEEPDFDQRVFVPSDPTTADPAWMAGGSYAVVRRIRMLLDDWETQPLDIQEQVIGRHKSTGAPLGGAAETDAVDLEATHPDGTPVIPTNAHIRVTSPDTNDGAAMLRRPFSYHDGYHDDGSPDAGLLFICWQADPLHGFVPIQRKLDRGDALSTFIRHEASSLFAVPGGAAEGGYVGQRLLEA
ncbi:iron uptake transporter deferrochelatase/peroxidase subunit [Streptomyces sp. 6N223]|uniref:iron uptake transporter deferrochelatase/peroxidase subunit n=1 Tax=Streptomyces sp. 6N223 TaxID=3457412 RepID=UPI003FD1B315